MRLRNGAHVDRVLDVNPVAMSAIAQHNASTPFLRMPLEVKNQIYEYVFGGNLIHVVQNPDKGGPKVMSYLCCASISEEEAQENFNSESDHPWYAPANERRHESCHATYDEVTMRYKKKRGLSLNPLRSCRQMYNEAHHIPYSANTFGCFEPETLQSFVTSLAQGSKTNHLAVRSLFLEMVYTEFHHMSSWEKAVATCTRQLTGVQKVSISIDWRQFDLIRGQNFTHSKEEGGLRWKKNIISSVLPLKKLPLKTATMVISDREAELMRDNWYSPPVRLRWIDAEPKYRWTLDEKKERARYVREVLLQS